MQLPCGEVSERFKEHAWKACVGEILPWVRIPPSPPYSAAAYLESHDRPHCRASPPRLPHRCWLYSIARWGSHDCYARARMAGDISWFELAGRGIYLGSPADGPHEAPGRARPRSGVAHAHAEKCPR